MKEELKITIIQTNLFWEDISKNLAHFEDKIRNLNQSADIIVLPEMFSTGFSMTPSKFAQTMIGESISWMKKIAKESSSLLIGSLIIKEEEKYYNRLLAVSSQGVINYYDKRHLFAMAGEGKAYNSGVEKIIFEYNGWKICPLICYDLRFPVWSRNQSNYDVLIYVANWPEKRSNHWKVLLQARAIENQSYVIGVNRIGQDGNQYIYSGDSCVFDPMGQKISKTKAFQDSVETVTLSRNELSSVRESLPFSADSDNFNLL